MPIETVMQTRFSTRQRERMRRKGSEYGAIAIMTPFVIIIMISMFGMALDLSRSYNRKAELQKAADAAALAAASSLDGTSAGIDRAVIEAEQTAEYSTFAYNTDSVSWSRGALTFGTSADGGPGSWVDATTAKASPSKIFFARVDTSAFDPKHGRVVNFLMPILSSALAESNVTATAVAGRDSINVLPLAICANANTGAAALPSGELVEYGFRRGVSYNLMNLNPIGRSPENFLVNPVAPPGTVGTTMKNRLDIVAPFICTGTMAMSTLQGGEVTVERGFPIDSLYEYLNSRFGKYTLPCRASTAPADQNVTSFDLANTKWMKDTPDGLSANPLTDPADPLLTVAEKGPAPAKTAYGPLWSYAKAVKYSSYTANKGVEPAAGYSTFSATVTDWGLLYTPAPEPSSYPSATPYQSGGGSAKYKVYRNTRVLQVPLLQCSASTAISTTASVLGIAKFFMTVPATSSALYAEFAGMNTESALGGHVRLYK
ncbi:pilus assembly protein TadG-related protein [Massilia jejuensis]|uniref:Pilus assembly protein TadG-related protein n=1 Tax=Massilia jejuensis TaxID=648894 RepID=A0ABW0PCT6_9BURK